MVRASLARRSVPSELPLGQPRLEGYAPIEQDLASARIAGIGSKGGATQDGIRVAEVPVIEDVEELGPELQAKALGDGNFFEQGEVLAVQARPAKGVLAQVAEGGSRIRQRRSARTKRSNDNTRAVQR